MLIHGLPADSAVWREETAWSNQDELAASHMELLDMWMRIQVQIWTGKKPTGEPLRIERPGQPKPEQKKTKRNPSAREVAAFFGQIK